MFCIFCFSNAWRNQLYLRGAPNSTPRLNPLAQAAKTWLICCALAALMRIIPQALWHDDWGRRHAEARLLILALALYLSLQFAKQFSHKSLKIWMGTCWVACVFGFGTTLWLQRDTPSHPIAWAASLSLIICLMLPHAMTWRSNVIKFMMWLGIGLGLCGVLMSQSRGAYGIVLWAVCMAVFYQHTHKAGLAFKVLVGFSLICALMFLGLTDSQDGLRIQEFWAQWQASRQHLTEGANSSVGARLFLWQQAWEAIRIHPVLGYGAESTVLQIENWGRSAQSEEVMRLGHLHNEFLDAWMSHGLLGLLSSLTLPIGLSWMCWQLRKSNPQTFFMLFGILWVHVSASLSNVNLAHNYYGTVLSLCVGLALWLGQRKSN